MSSLQVLYNGILLDMCENKGWVSDSEYNGPDYLMTKHTLTVASVINPYATAYTATPTQNPGAAANSTTGPYWFPTPSPGTSPMVTAFHLQQQLQVPRKLLWISMPACSTVFFPENAANGDVPTQYNDFMNSFVVDPRNGPFPRRVIVKEMIGAQTFTCDFTIEFYTIRSPKTTPNVVLSHRWTQEDSIDLPHYLTRRTTRGRVILRTDSAIDNLVWVDDFRDAICMPIIPNCQRTHVDVAVSEDGSTAQYTLVDEEKLMNLRRYVTAMGVTDIQCTHSSEVSKPSGDEVLMRAAGAFTYGAGQGAAFGGSILPGTGLAGGLLFGAIQVGLTCLQMLPRCTHTIVCRVFGNQVSMRKQMESLGLGIAVERLKQALDLSICSTFVMLTHDTMGKYVEVTIRAKEGVGNVIQRTGLALQVPNWVGGATPQDFLAALLPAVGIIAQLPQQAFAINGNIMPDIEYGATANAQPVPTTGLAIVNAAIDADLPKPPSTQFVNYTPPAGLPPAPMPIFNVTQNPAQPLGVLGARELAGAPINQALFGSAVGSRGTMLNKLLTQYFTGDYNVPNDTPLPTQAVNYNLA
jgi:hypothetical protein